MTDNNGYITVSKSKNIVPKLEKGDVDNGNGPRMSHGS
jgi:hypothetical protein